MKEGRLHFSKFGEIDYAIDILPQERTLLVDIDTRDGETDIPSLYSLCRVIGLHPVNVCYKRTRRGWHIIIVCKESFSEVERICLQSIFGDDEFRSALNFMRYWSSKGIKVTAFWKKRSNILYKRKLV